MEKQNKKLMLAIFSYIRDFIENSEIAVLSKIRNLQYTGDVQMVQGKQMARK